MHFIFLNAVVPPAALDFRCCRQPSKNNNDRFLAPNSDRFMHRFPSIAPAKREVNSRRLGQRRWRDPQI